MGIRSGHNGYSQPGLASPGSTGNFKQEAASWPSVARGGQDITEMGLDVASGLSSALSAPDGGGGEQGDLPDWLLAPS